MTNIFQNSKADLASSKITENLKFEREDWTVFRTVEGLQQKAGVPTKWLRRLVLKELTDNALDTGAEARVDELPDGGYFVEDKGAGIKGTTEEIARLFSIARPMLSTKLLRLPTRGALGNGLRVVAGAVLASGGSLVVITRNKRIELRSEHDGSTTVVSAKPVKCPLGTRIEISFGPALPDDVLALSWAEDACMLARTGRTYLGKSSPWWYDATQFRELLSASDRPVREVIAALDGCAGNQASEIVAKAGLERARCNDITPKQAVRLLEWAQNNARQVNPQRLGAVGAEAFPGYAYGHAHGVVELGSAEPQAEVPFVVEAWAASDRRLPKTILRAYVNRTPITGAVNVARDKREINFFGCGLRHTIAEAPKDAQFDISLNIITPYMPITSDGKEPNLEPFLDGILTAVGKAVRKAHRPNAGTKQTQKDVVLEHLDEAIASASGDGAYRFNERQIFYQLRPIVLEKTGQPLQIGNFKAILTDYQNEHGEIPLMYSEPRGSIYHPHRGETITLGTLMVEEYKRPEWTYNKLVYIEKEGFSEALKDARWAERHDCMLMSSKGFSTRAARDLVDKLAEHNEPVTIFCVHDADAYGTMIYQTLQEATKARGARRVKIVNLGLEPWEANEMGLESEDVEGSEKRKPVADYVRERDDGHYWEEWLQTNRVELNAMTTPEFIEWLDSKMEEYGDGKLVPPHDVLEAELDERIEKKVRDDIREHILREAGFEDRVAEAIAAIKTPSGAALTKGVRRLFKQEPDVSGATPSRRKRRSEFENRAAAASAAKGELL
jgi:hypothetical protein